MSIPALVPLAAAAPASDDEGTEWQPVLRETRTLAARTGIRAPTHLGAASGTRSFALIALCLLTLCLAHTPLQAMSTDEAAAETVQESYEETLAGLRRGDTTVPERLLRGRFYAQVEATREQPDVLGVFVVRGRAYRLKAGNERLRAELLKRTGQDLTLEGEVRVRGTYFIAQRFAAALPPAVALRDRKGL